MNRMIHAAAAAAAVALLAAPAMAADLPKATQDIMKELKLPDSMLSGLDKELEVPAEWMAKAKAGKKLVILSTWDNNQFRKLAAPFRERYPFIDISYSRSSYNARVVKTLIAWKEQRYLADIVTGFGGGYFLFRDADALEDLRDIPSFKNNVPEGMKDPNGHWVGQRLRYWCISYNTDKIKKADLPKTWEDITKIPAWHDGTVGVGNRPQLWLLMLWGKKGEAWTRQYMADFVNKVQPQLRKEGTNAMVALTIAGEMHAAIPSAAYRTKQYVDKGAPISWHCPEPVPLAVSEMGIIKGAPNTAAAKIFANWFLSKEGQIAQFAADQAPPVHKDLQTREFLSFPDEIIGKEVAFRGPEAEHYTKQVFAAWDPIWKKNAGKTKLKLVTFSSEIKEVKQRGRTIVLSHNGQPREVMISGSRSNLTIAGKKESRRKLKAGMTCEITLPEKGVEATKATCK